MSAFRPFGDVWAPLQFPTPGPFTVRSLPSIVIAFFLSAYNDSNIMHIWVVPNSSESLTQFVVCSLASLSFPFTSILLFSLVSGSQAYTSWGFEHHMPPLWIAIYLEHLQMNLIFIFCYQPFESCTFFSYYATCIYFYLHLPSPPDSSTFDLPLPLSNAIDYDITSATNSKGDILQVNTGLRYLPMTRIVSH